MDQTNNISQLYKPRTPNSCTSKAVIPRLQSHHRIHQEEPTSSSLANLTEEKAIFSKTLAELMSNYTIDGRNLTSDTLVKVTAFNVLSPKKEGEKGQNGK